jgi:hypothetical protein
MRSIVSQGDESGPTSYQIDRSSEVTGSYFGSLCVKHDSDGVPPQLVVLFHQINDLSHTHCMRGTVAS